ncbi:peptidase M24, partial [Streptomyces varsoviensis]
MPSAAASPLTTEDYAARMERASRAAADAGLAGLVVTPGPDLSWLCGSLEKPDAEHAAGAGAVRISGWTDGEDPYRAVG